MAMNKAHRVFPSVLYALGFVAIYFGQRILEVGKPSTVVTFLGVLLLAAAVVSRVLLMRALPAQHQAAQRALIGLYALGLVAVALYFLNSNVYFELTGKTMEQRMPRLSGVVAALWPALFLTGTLPVLFVELSLSTMKQAPVLDHGRVRSALMSALGISFALVFSFAISYVASERDVKKDFSHFRTTRAGEATKKLVRALDKPVQVALFYPPANEVREEVESYFADLVRESKHLVVEHYDHALHPAKARELNVTGNGIIVISRGAIKEQLSTPLQLEAARSQLRVLDQDVHKKIIAVSRPDRTAYFTTGHEERTFDAIGDTDRRSTIKALRDLVSDLGFEPKDLGLAQGLGADVPNDAAIVLIIGPRKPFLKEETDALVRYLDRKGRLFIALDPDGGVPMEEVLAPLALKYNPVTVANDRLYITLNQNKGDRVNVVTGSYSSHASVSTITRFGMRAPVFMLGAGFLEKNEKTAVGIVNVDFTVHADGSTWNDKNGNFEHDQGEGENRQAYELAAAVNKRNASAIAVEDEARAVVLADSDAVSDAVLQRAVGNAYLARDGIRWLAGEEQYIGAINNEEDVPVTHTRKQDTVWFYTTTFAAPVAVLSLGFAMTRRRRPRKKAKPARPATPAAAAPGPEVKP